MPGPVSDSHPGKTSRRRNPHVPSYLNPARDNDIAGIGPALKAIDERADKVSAIGLRAVAEALNVDLTELALATGEAVIRMQVESPFKDA